MSFRSAISSLFTPDEPATLIADWFLSKPDRQRIDAQILATQQQIAYSLRGQHTTEVLLHSSSAAGNVGDCVCTGPVAATEDDPLTAARYVVRAIGTTGGSPIVVSGLVLGILVTPAIPGGWGRIATGGIVGPAITGLVAGSSGPVKVDQTTARCVRVASFASGNYPVGFVDGNGNLTLAKGFVIP